MTSLSEAAVRQLEQHGRGVQPYLSRMLEAGNIYTLAAALASLRDAYRKWTPDEAHEARQEAVTAAFGQGYELIAPTDRLIMQRYQLEREWNDLLRTMMKEAERDGQKGE